MQVVILAGGAGKRVFPLAVNKPKPMFRILGKPLIQYVMETMGEAGLKDFIIVTGHQGEQIRNFFEDGSKFGFNIQYTYQKEALGMANALETTKDLVENNFFVVNADDIFESFLIKDMMKKFEKSDAEIILSCKPVIETWKFGIIKIEDDRVTRFVEKPEKGKEPSNLAVIGVYIMTRKIFDYYKKVPISDHQYEDAIQKFILDGNVVRAVSYDGFFSAYKYPWDLFTINEYLMNKMIKKQTIEDNVSVSEKAQIEGKVWIKDGSKVLENTCIRGPCYIGSNSLIGNNSLIWNYSSIGDNCVVGFSSEIKNSLIGDNCWFHKNYIGDSIILDCCSFGSGATTANFRFDGKPIKVKIDGKLVDSGRDKLGAMIADGCQMGINSSIMPGVKIGPNSIVGPGVCLQEDLEPNKIIFMNKKSYVIRENKITISPEKKRELMERLIKREKK
ncbi:MAG: sugar phosphate nucleotidyltransferase [Candidatus Aenigmarchaeota archaeon]|nr:sugar phosphate nucleotidyltransferase [Candidatus Aenigmarchaeota archaeon]